MNAVARRPATLARKVESPEMTRERTEKETSPQTWRDAIELAEAGRLTTEQVKRMSHSQRGALATALVARTWTLPRIADLFDVSERAIRYRLSRRGTPFGKRGGTKHIGAFIPGRVAQVIEEVAADAQLSSAAQIARALAVVFSDREKAKKFLGKAALPTRPYRREVR